MLLFVCNPIQEGRKAASGSSCSEGSVVMLAQEGVFREDDLNPRCLLASEDVSVMHDSLVFPSNIEAGCPSLGD